MLSLIAFMVFDPIEAYRHHEEYREEWPVVWFVVDDSRESRLLHSQLTRDWEMWCQPEIADKIAGMRVSGIRFVKWNDRESVVKNRLRFGDDFPCYRVGGSGRCKPFPKRAFNVNFWVIPSVECVVNESWLASDRDKYGVYLDRYNYNYNFRCRNLIRKHSAENHASQFEYFDLETYDIDIERFQRENPEFEYPEWEPADPPAVKYPWELIGEQ
jgi:hypothetical protein